MSVVLILLALVVIGLLTIAMSSQSQRRSIYGAIIYIGILCATAISMVVGAFTHRSIDANLSSGGRVRITPPSFWGSCLSKEGCKIVYRPRDGEAGTVTFWESSPLQLDDGQPAMIIPAAGSNCLLILYDADVQYRLVKVNPSKPSTKFAEGSYLNYIILSSPWEIEEGTSNDWGEVRSYLKAVPQTTFDQQAVTTCDFGVVRLHYGREELLSGVERAIYNLQWTKK